jgi:alkaline phosphatase D
VGTSITSSFPFGEVIDVVVPTREHIKYGDGHHHGYVRCDVTRDELRADFRYVTGVQTPDVSIETGAAFVIGDRRPGALRA